MAHTTFITLSLLLFVLTVNALSIDSHIQARHAHLGRAFAKRARCKNRPHTPATSSSPPASTPAPPPNANTTPTTSNKPVSTPPASTGGGKASLALAVWEPGQASRILKNFKSAFPQTNTFYNWDAITAVDPKSLGFDFAPIMTKTLSNWDKVVGGYARYALGFNEPNHEGSLINPTTAANIWNQRMRPLKNQGYNLISPAVSSKEDAESWMTTFKSACGNNCFDFCAVHWYGTDPAAFIEYIKKWHQICEVPIWVTEFACHDFTSQSSCRDVVEFARTVRDFMNSAPYVAKFFPFVVGPADDSVFHGVGLVNNLLNGEAPNDLAKIYFG